MKVFKDWTGSVCTVEVERSDTLEEMAAMAGMTMDALGKKISKIINESRNNEEESK